jgi:hypothetical protein
LQPDPKPCSKQHLSDKIASRCRQPRPHRSGFLYAEIRIVM